jgi:hypothetical protein
VQESAPRLIDTADDEADVFECGRNRRWHRHVARPSAGAVADRRRGRFRPFGAASGDDNPIGVLGRHVDGDATADDAIAAHDEDQFSGHSRSSIP